MKKSTLTLLISTLVLLLIPLSSRFSRLRGDLFTIKQVLDGDTIEVFMSGRVETVRFIGIDTPETHHPDVGVQCYGEEATKNLKSLIGQKVQLVADPNSTNRDRYDRLLRYIYSETGVFLNLEQIRGGYAFATTAFKHSLLPLFIAEEARVSSIGRGLWSACELNLNSGYFHTNEL